MSIYIIILILFIVSIFIIILKFVIIEYINEYERIDPMQNVTLGERIQVLRKNMKMSQKEFAVFLEIPQPSLSAYENNRNSPTIEVLINIARKCHISLDWLCGISTYQHQLSSLSDVGDFLYSLLETNEIGVDIEIHDKLFNDIETDEDRWYTRLTFFGNDEEHESNADICFLIDKVSKDCCL